MHAYKYASVEKQQSIFAHFSTEWNSGKAVEGMKIVCFYLSFAFGCCICYEHNCAPLNHIWVFSICTPCLLSAHTLLCHTSIGKGWMTPLPSYQASYFAAPFSKQLFKVDYGRGNSVQNQQYSQLLSFIYSPFPFQKTTPAPPPPAPNLHTGTSLCLRKATTRKKQ